MQVRWDFCSLHFLLEKIFVIATSRVLCLQMSCISIVIDCDARHWGELVEKEKNENLICTLIHSISSYSTAHMSLSAANRVVVIGVDGALSEPIIYAASSDVSFQRIALKTKWFYFQIIS